MNKTNLLIPVLALGLIGSALAITSVRQRNLEFSSDTKVALVDVSSQREGEPFDDHVQLAALTSDLRPMAKNLGERLHKLGMERVTYAGMMHRTGETRAMPFTLTWELPGRLRFLDYGRQQITVFDGQTVSRSRAASTSLDNELLETLICDSADHLFISQMRGLAIRSLGSRFRISEDSRGEYAGPFYDIFELTESLPWGQDNERTRQYWFNSDTQVLERVKYRISSNGLDRSVDVRLTNWLEVNGQRWPSRIIRLENDIPVLSLDFNLASTVISARVEDGMFSHPPDNR